MYPIFLSRFNFCFDINKGIYAYYTKTYSWSYENECRLVISINNSVLKEKKIDIDKCFILIEIEKDKDGKSPIVKISPNYNGNPEQKLGKNYKKSKYYKKINWNIYELIKEEKEENRKGL